MAYQTFQEFNSTDMAGLFVYPAQVVPIFIPLLLFVIFCIAVAGTYFTQLRLRGRGDFIVSLAVGGFLIGILAFVMSLIEGLINLTTLVICVIVAIVTAILLFIPREQAI